MKSILAILVVIFCLWPKAPSYGEDLHDYSQLDHQIQIKQLRSGKYSDDDLHQLNLEVQAQAYLADDKKSDEETIELGSLGSYELVPLGFLSIDQAQSFVVSGDEIRKLVSQQMFKLSCSEAELNVKIKIKVDYVSKKYYILEEKTPLGEISYNIIDQNTAEVFRIPKREFSFKDEKGGFLKVSLQKSEE